MEELGNKSHFCYYNLIRILELCSLCMRESNLLPFSLFFSYHLFTCKLKIQMLQVDKRKCRRGPNLNTNAYK